MVQKGNADVCPTTKEDWEARAAAKRGDCGGQSVYHCLADDQGGKWERCVERTLVIKGNCPIFADDGFIGWKPCDKTKPPCPDSSFLSDEVYKYPECFGDNTPSLETKPHRNDSGNAVGLVIGVTLGVMFLVSAMAVLVFLLRRRSNNGNDVQELNTSLISSSCTPNEGHTPKRLKSDERSADEIANDRNVNDGISLLMKDKSEVKSIIVMGKLGSSVSSTSRRISEEFRKSIIVMGKLGSSVSSTSRRISEEFRPEEGWTSLECRYTDIPTTVAENTVMYVYGWFGMWNDDLCSLDKAKTACQSLIRILNDIKNVKIIVGMRSDLFKKYHDEFEQVDEQNMSLFYHEINLDSADVQKDDEYLKYLEEKIQKQCKQINCACQELTYEMLRKGKGKVVGIPLKINVLEKYHELIPNYLDNCDILNVMRDHFISIENDCSRRRLCEWIKYVCLKGKYKRSDSLDASVVKAFGLKIDDSSFDENDTELSKYLRIRNSDRRNKVPSSGAQYVFWHPFIYICAFHYLFNKNPALVMTHCNLEAIFELVRKQDTKVSYFEVTADDHIVTLFKERIRQLGKHTEYMCHPLMQ